MKEVRRRNKKKKKRTIGLFQTAMDHVRASNMVDLTGIMAKLNAATGP